MKIFNRLSEIQNAGLGMLLVLASVLYFPSILQMVKFWLQSPAYSHSVLLVPICVYLVYKRITKYQLQQHITPIYIVLLLLSVLLWVISNTGNIQVIEFIALFAIYFSVLLFYFGTRQVFALAILLLMLIFTLPVWGYLSVVARIITIPFVDVMLELSGIDFRFDGFLVILKSGTFIIEESCSGLHQITAAVPLLIIYAHNRIYKPVYWVLLSFGAVLVAFVANTIRIYVVIVIGDITSMQHSLVREHGLIGWIIFGVIFALYIAWLEKYMMKKIENPEYMPVITLKPTRIKNGFSRQYIFALVVLMMGPVLNEVFNYPQYATHVTATGFDAALPWKARQGVPEYKPDFPDGDVTINKIYENITGSNVNLFLALYVNEKQGVEAVNNLNKIYDEEKWQLVKDSTISFAMGETGFVAKEKIIGSRSGRYYLLWHGYIVDNRFLIRDVQVKLTGLQQRMLFKPGVAFFTISKKIEINYAVSRSQMKSFVIENMLYIQKQLGAPS